MPDRTLPLDAIRLGNRARQHVDDCKTLAESIRTVGLLHPIVVDGEGNLIAGRRRLRAVELLGWKTVPVTVALSVTDAMTALRAEMDENVQRVHLTPSEAVELASRLEPLERAEAKKRQEEAGGPAPGKRTACVESTQAVGRKARDSVADAVGIGWSKLKQAREVVQAARQAPKKYGDLVSRMDARGNVSGAYKDLQRRREVEEREAAQQKIKAAMISKDLDSVCDLHVCSCSDLFAAGVRPDAVITDPPYPKEFLSVFLELAEACKSVPLVAVMAGQSYLPDVMQCLCKHLSYRWTLAYLTPGGQSVQQWEAKVNTFWKPVLLFGESAEWFGDVCKSNTNDNDKRFHDWGQSESGMADLVERLTKPGQLVCDPFLGGGTTAVVSLALGRRFVGCDVDALAVAKSKKRLEKIACSLR